MEHILKGKWRTYIVVDVPDLRYLFSDGELDLTNITEDGDTKDCTHGGIKLTGKVKEVGSGNDRTFLIPIERNDGKRKWDARFVRDRNGEKVMSGTVIFPTRLTFSVGSNTFSQLDGTWIATQP